MSNQPIAWGMRRPDGLILDVICPDEHEAYEGQYTVPLYAAPQPRRRLTDEELGKIINANWGVGVWQMARAIEAAVWGEQP